MRLFTRLLCTVAAACGLGTSSAAPLDSDSLIWMLQYETGFAEVYSVNATTPSLEHRYASTLGNDIRARGDLTTGEVGTSVYSAAGRFGQSQVNLFDTLRFTTTDGGPATVSYRASFDGALSSSSTFSNPYAQYRVTVYDITGLDHWLESVSLAGLFDRTRVVDEAAEVSDVNIFHTLSGMARGTYEFDTAESASFIAEPGRVYGVSISSNSASGDLGYSDFLGTGRFAFTDLGGASFTSASGWFLTGVGALPGPATWLLLLTGVLGLAVRRVV